MRVHVVSTPVGICFCGSKAEAATARASFSRSGVHRKDIETHEVDVPTNKDQLLSFLNRLTGQASVVEGAKAITAHFALTRKD